MKRSKTAGRIKYEAQIEVIKKQLGDLEHIRKNLDLTQRKICQLLLVDPSAWSRWIKGDAPPHIYRALQWYLALNEKFPGLGSAYWLSSVAHGSSSSYTDKLESKLEKMGDHQHGLTDLISNDNRRIEQLENAISQLAVETKKHKYRLWLALAAVLLAAVVALVTATWYR